ncbi:MAG: DNA replication and repair protein RecF [Chloroflexi bacterium ADurb.Bin344]|nr:MAG: DNA replication and repair protein RecF [Chloroflexi bacterium ADurb.Bin344]
MTDRQEKLALIYNPSFDPLNPDRSNPVEENSVRRDGFSADEIASAMKAHLKTIRRREIERGTSVAGPHRDDFQVCANDIDLSLYGSRGQIRTALLSLKMAEIRWIQDKTGTEPLLLLDETLAELDEKRRRDLLERLDQYNQGILTTTDLTHFSDDFLKKHTVWQIANGVVKKD